MSFLYRLRFVAAAALLLRTATAQTCYYPDGLTISDDIPCNNNADASSCCPTGSFCMDNGLCFGGGIVSRASCTDQSWGSTECAQYCTDNKSSPVSLTACDADTRTFTCGLDTTQCQSDNSTFVMAGGNALVLRPAQVEALTAGYTAGSHKNGASYGAGTLIGVALGIGLPLLFALVMALLVLRKEKQRCALRSMFEEQNLPSINVSSANPRRSFSTVSKAGTLTTISSTSTFKPQQPRAFLEKYGYHKGYYAHEGDLSVPVFELPTNPPERNDRVEAP